MATGIYDAAVLGDREEAERIVTCHPEAVNEVDEHGFAPLHGLAGEDHAELAQYLIDHGANVNAGNDEGITPLHLVTSLSGLFARLLGRKPTATPQDVWELASAVHRLLSSTFQEFRWQWDGPPTAASASEPPKPA